jgi:two-component system alkaline phosphatase synthesis response regulator PhoP
VWRCGPSSEPKKLGSGSADPRLGRRVLVVDDEVNIRLLCRVNLAASGIEVLEAEDGATGLELARSERPDLILLDVMMPGLDGWEVARKLAADPKTSEIPVVFLTARAGDEDRHLGEEAGAVGYVVKPFDPVSIATVVELTLARVGRGESEALRREITKPPKEPAE